LTKLLTNLLVVALHARERAKPVRVRRRGIRNPTPNGLLRLASDLRPVIGVKLAEIADQARRDDSLLIVSPQRLFVIRVLAIELERIVAEPFSEDRHGAHIAHF